MIPEIDMKVLTETGVAIQSTSIDEAREQVELGTVQLGKHGEDFYEFDVDRYINKLSQTDWADAFMRLHKSLNGTYEECTDGSTWWDEADYEHFENYIKEKLGIKESKWLFDGMTKDEIRNGYEEVQRELKECENVKD